jgi:hypothetical protein
VAKSKRGRAVSPGIVAAVMTVAATVAGLAYWQLHRAPEKPGAKAATQAPALPAGRLILLERGVSDVRYLALDEAKPADGFASAVVLVVAKTANGLEGGAAMSVMRKRVDCSRQRVFDEALGYFDYDGRPMKTETYYSGRHGRPPAYAETQAEIPRVCGASPVGHAFAGYRGAQREAQMPPEDYERLIAGRSVDPAVAAWLCAAGARGRWRETTPGDCDRAVKLNPGLAEAGLDRGFLHLKLGNRQRADAAFREVLAREPANATARFGRGLLAAMGGDKAASKKLRGEALAADADIPKAIEARYGFYISSEYRTL